MANPAANQTKPQVLIVEEDDEFQEFEEKNWPASAQDKSSAVASKANTGSKNLWQDDWDVDEADDDFVQQLRQELQNNK